MLGATIDQAPDVFLGFNDAFLAEPVVVRVPAGVAVDAPVVVAHLTEGEGLAAFPRLVVEAGDDSEVSVLEIQVSGPEPSLVVPVTEIAVGRAARVGHLTVQQLGLACWQLGLQVASVDAEASLRTTTVGFGGDYARQRTDCRMVGRGATGELDAVYFGEGDQTLDFRTFQDHVAPDCTSNLLFKGAVGGRSRSVYTGMIRVGKQARGTNAFQTNRNVKLSDGAWAESVPNLVIENNDVRCSHASAVGPIDEEQRFYLESRGVPTDEAERLIVTGFFDEVLGRAPVPAVVPLLRSTVAAKFERREGWCPSTRYGNGFAASTSWRRARPAGSRSASGASPSCGSATTSMPSATAARTRTSPSPRARCTPRRGRSSAGSTAASSRSRRASP